MFEHFLSVTAPCNPQLLRSSVHLLNLLQALEEVLPVVHHHLDTDVLHQNLLHLALLDDIAVAADVPQGRNPSTDRTRRAALAVLHRDTLGRLDAKDLAGMQIDGRIGLAGRLGQRGRRAEDPVGREEPVLVHFLDGRLDTPERARAHDRQLVLPVVVQLLQGLGRADAGLRLGLERRDDLVLLLQDVRVELVIAHLEAVLLLQRDHHAAEVLAHEVDEQLRARVALAEAMFFEDRVGERGARFEGELFRQDKCVVAVEEDVGDL